MSFTVVPFRAFHVEEMNLQPYQARMSPLIPAGYVELLSEMGPAATAQVDGEVIACAGVAMSGEWMGTLWAFLSANSGKHFVRLHRCAGRLLSLCDARRIEATTAVDFKPGCRWLTLLGFEAEGVARAYGPLGEDHMRYARLK